MGPRRKLCQKPTRGSALPTKYPQDCAGALELVTLCVPQGTSEARSKSLPQVKPLQPLWVGSDLCQLYRWFKLELIRADGSGPGRGSGYGCEYGPHGTCPSPSLIHPLLPHPLCPCCDWWAFIVKTTPVFLPAHRLPTLCSPFATCALRWCRPRAGLQRSKVCWE